jgi:dihydroorotate dehydrogenase electron transfer subunit
MAIQTDGIVLDNRRIQSSYYLMELDCPHIAEESKPGQFLMVQTSENNHPLLRRPFSIYRSCSSSYPQKGKRGHIFILYKKVGLGTQKMTAFQKGKKVGLIGPLGNGFTIPPLPSQIPAILIGGGVGMAALSALREVSQNLYIFIGGKTKDDILCENDFPKGKIFIASEDGSRGYKGTVVDLFLSEKKRFDQNLPHQVYLCGPEGMLRALSKIIDSKKWTVQVSLESHMGCGFGACWGCVVKTKDPRTVYQRVCKDGPVFPLSEIVWES